MSFESLLEPDRRWMELAFKEAERAFDLGEVPIGAVVVRNRDIVGRGHNLVERLKDPTAHAEIIAITAACETLGTKFLDGCTLYVTLEPCPMCAGEIVWSRVDRIDFGAYGEKGGEASAQCNIPQDPRALHRVAVSS